MSQTIHAMMAAPHGNFGATPRRREPNGAGDLLVPYVLQ
jgi:hypothetical protein